jgi:hypothetical protein
MAGMIRKKNAVGNTNQKRTFTNIPAIKPDITQIIVILRNGDTFDIIVY